MKGRDRLEKKK